MFQKISILTHESSYVLMYSIQGVSRITFVYPEICTSINSLGLEHVGLIKVFVPYFNRHCCWRFWRLGSGCRRLRVRLHDRTSWHWSVWLRAPRVTDHPNWRGNVRRIQGCGPIPRCPGQEQELNWNHVGWRHTWMIGCRTAERNLKSKYIISFEFVFHFCHIHSSFESDEHNFFTTSLDEA